MSYVNLNGLIFVITLISLTLKASPYIYEMSDKYNANLILNPSIKHKCGIIIELYP